jgi:hypothetical protein
LAGASVVTAGSVGMVRLGTSEGYDGTVCLIELSHISAISLALHVRYFPCIKSTLLHLKADLVHQSSLKSNSPCLYIPVLNILP